MILSYRDKRTAAFANRESVPAFRGIEQQAWKRLRILGAASSVSVLRALRSNRLEGF
jgi:proteic killer suppression protein